MSPPTDPQSAVSRSVGSRSAGSQSDESQSGGSGPAGAGPPAAALSAILLAGGRGSRMGGVEKALLRRGEQTQLHRWLRELAHRDICTVVVGSPVLAPQIRKPATLVREAPAFAGPAAAVLAGAWELRRRRSGSGAVPNAGPASPGWTLLLAVDLTEPGALLDWLLAQLGLSCGAPFESNCENFSDGGSAAVLPRDESGRDQYLSAAVPTGWLLERAGELTPGEVADRSIRWLLHGLGGTGLRRPVVPDGLSDDADTVGDARRLGLDLP